MTYEEFAGEVQAWIQAPHVEELLAEETEEEEEDEEEDNDTPSGPELFKQYAQGRLDRAHLSVEEQEEEDAADEEEAVAILSGAAQDPFN